MKKFENILLASDVDGTFAWKFSYINPKNLEAIEYFKQNGGRFLFSSGRNTKDVRFMIEDMDALVNAPCVLCNGSLLYDLKTDKCENEYFLDEKEAVELVKFIREYDITMGWRASYIGGFCICAEDTSIIESLRRNNLLQFAKIVPFKELDGKGYYKAVINSTKEKLAPLYGILSEKFKNLDFTTSVETLIEICPKGITKATQLEYLRNKYETNGCDIKVVCVGDYDNDIDMLKYADLSFCPSNARDNVKEICDIEVCHCQDGAIYEVIKYLDEHPF